MLDALSKVMLTVAICLEGGGWVDEKEGEGEKEERGRCWLGERRDGRKGAGALVRSASYLDSASVPPSSMACLAHPRRCAGHKEEQKRVLECEYIQRGGEKQGGKKLRA